MPNTWFSGIIATALATWQVYTAVALADTGNPTRSVLDDWLSFARVPVTALWKRQRCLRMTEHCLLLAGCWRSWDAPRQTGRDGAPTAPSLSARN